MKTYEVLYKFSDIVINIEAENEEAARKKANELLKTADSPREDTYCYDIEVEEER